MDGGRDGEEGRKERERGCVCIRVRSDEESIHTFTLGRLRAPYLACTFHTKRDSLGPITGVIGRRESLGNGRAKRQGQTRYAAGAPCNASQFKNKLVAGRDVLDIHTSRGFPPLTHRSFAISLIGWGGGLTFSWTSPGSILTNFEMGTCLRCTEGCSTSTPIILDPARRWTATFRQRRGALLMSLTRLSQSSEERGVEGREICLLETHSNDVILGALTSRKVRGAHDPSMPV